MIDIAEARALFERAHCRVGPDAWGNLAIWSLNEPTFVLRTLKRGWGPDDLAAWAIDHWTAIFDELETLRMEVGQ